MRLPAKLALSNLRRNRRTTMGYFLRMEEMPRVSASGVSFFIITGYVL